MTFLLGMMAGVAFMLFALIVQGALLDYFKHR